MANTSPHGPEISASPTVSPAADLDLLNRAKSAVHVDQFLNFGPWWYAPLLATTIGGAVLFGQAFGTFLWNGVVGLVAVAAACLLSVHDYRRRGVRSRPSARGAAWVAVTVALCWLIIAVWGTAISSLGYERFVPGYAALGWVLTSLLFLAVRGILLAIRGRRAPLQ